ncbi:hypothetical protein JNB62_05525 [Microbacterium jejuense]|uniref:Uncharacterized protein n=1 Tax=Microbacterium jejuense TaxID=1263637 RepID=A0ABS7HJK5_9MICO|nr:hypothetical protein [Microbacterium jejuense]MBW9093136.1 hypothetical protein [Microbacterium jejuense]
MIVMTAMFATKCDACGGMIQPGQKIGALPDGDWTHVVCPPAKFDITRDVCPECFTERSVTGACMCPEVA